MKWDFLYQITSTDVLNSCSASKMISILSKGCVPPLSYLNRPRLCVWNLGDGTKLTIPETQNFFCKTPWRWAFLFLLLYCLLLSASSFELLVFSGWKTLRCDIIAVLTLSSCLPRGVSRGEPAALYATPLVKPFNEMTFMVHSSIGVVMINKYFNIWTGNAGRHDMFHLKWMLVTLHPII